MLICNMRDKRENSIFIHLLGFQAEGHAVKSLLLSEIVGLLMP